MTGKSMLLENMCSRNPFILKTNMQYVHLLSQTYYVIYIIPKFFFNYFKILKCNLSVLGFLIQ